MFRKAAFLKEPRWPDAFLLSLFVVLVTFQPFYIHHEIIMMETGIHLPALNALFHGAVPYRDFFVFRGPLELYVPAVVMLVLGKNSAVLPLFYYAGTVATLLVLAGIGKQLYRTRFIFYLMAVVLTARTFPRVSYYYWGGMRYALGALSVYFVILFLKNKKSHWIFLAGITSAFSLLTTIEAGFCSFAAV